MKTIVIYEYQKPEKKQEKDFSKLEKIVDEYMDEIQKTEQFSNDESHYFCGEELEHYIFEEVIVAFYGKDVWKYINERLR